MRIITIAAFFCGLICLQACHSDLANAQYARKPAGAAIVNYQPSDPWTRGRVFNLQTGNSGWFYNCDGEQCKRYSPYICWKPDIEPILPPFVAPWTTWKQQLDDVRQRVYDGSCGQRGYNCDACNAARQNGQVGCAACVQAAAAQAGISKSDSAGSAVSNATPVQPVSIDPAHGTRFGLVKGKIIEPAATRQVEAPAPRPIKESSVARKSLLEQLRSTTRR